MRPITQERPPKMMRLDALSSSVPAIEAGARALWERAEKARNDFRMTDYQHHVADAKELESLARRLDVRRMSL